MSISKAHKALLIGLAFTAPSVWALDGSVSADYVSTFVAGDPLMTFGVKAQETLPHDLKLSIGQSVNRNLVVDDSKHVWEWNDTVIALAKSYEHSESLTWGWRLSGTLPVSIASRHNELRTKGELGLSATAKLPADITSVTGASYAQYWHKYDSTRPEGQTGGGEALPQYTYSVSQSLSYSLMSSFDLGLSASYRVIRFHDLYQTEGYIAAENRLEDTSYSLGASVTYNHSDKTSLSFGFEQGSGLERPNYDDFVFFDEQEAVWTVSLLQVW